jgi:transcriptional regulator with XRE-family HTH domain
MSIDSVKNDLLQNFRESKEYREAFVEESVYTTVAFQVAAIREHRGLSQKQLGRLVGMAQERISILEDPNADTKPTLNTLLRLANGYDCGLEVRFIPFSKVLTNSFNNGPEALRVLNFEDEAMEIEDPDRLTILVRNYQTLQEAASGSKAAKNNTPLVSIDSSPQFSGGTEPPPRFPPARQTESVEARRSGTQ